MNCQWCDEMHKGTCPRVTAIEYFENGMVKRVEFVPPQQHFHQAPLYYLPDQTRKEDDLYPPGRNRGRKL